MMENGETIEVEPLQTPTTKPFDETNEIASKSCCTILNQPLQLRTFILTFGSYALFHATRKSFAAVKHGIETDEWMHSDVYSKENQSQMFVIMDTCFLAFYAVGLYLSGMIGDRVNIKYFLIVGMSLTGVLQCLFSIFAFANMHTFKVFLVIWSLNGLLQSCGWPSNVAIMGKWFTQEQRGRVMGAWSGCGSFGNMFGSGVVSLIFYLFETSFAWKFAFLVCGCLIFSWTIAIYFFLEPEPPSDLCEYQHVPRKSIITSLHRNEAEDVRRRRESVSHHHEDEEDAEESVTESSIEVSPLSPTTTTTMPEEETKLVALSFWQAWYIPGVAQYALTYACIKSVDYALFFWLPFYLTVSLRMTNSSADSFSMFYDLGQICGGLLGGYLTDRMGIRSPVIVSSLIIASFILFYLSSASNIVLGFLLLCCGAFIGGPSTLIGTAISADLGTHSSIKKSKDALATVAGIIDGTGSIGAALFQYVIGLITKCQNSPAHCIPSTINTNCHLVCEWKPLFFFLEILCLIAAILLSSLLKHEIERWRQLRRNRRTEVLKEF